MRRKWIPMGLIVGLLEATTDAESVDALLREVVASGRVTDEQATVISAQVQSGDQTALDQLWAYSYEEERGAVSRLEEDAGDGVSYQDYGQRVGAMVGVDGQRIADAIGHASEERDAVEREFWDNGSGRNKEGTEGPGRHLAEIASAG